MGWPLQKTPEYLGASGSLGYLEGPKEVGPYLDPGEEEDEGKSWAREIPREEPVEGEFRELPSEEGPRPPFGAPIMDDREAPFTEEELEEFQRRQARRMQREAWERRQGLARQVGQEEGEAEKARRLRGKVEKEELKAVRRRLQKQARPPYAKIAGKVATLGGVPMTPTQRKELYFGRAKKSLYAPGTPAEAVPSRKVLREATSFSGESLRGATSLPMEGIRKSTKFPTREESPTAGMVVPSLKGLASTRGQGVALGRLREASIPRGLTQIEKFTFQEIVGNGDRDTPKHVVSELRSIGISGDDAKKAIGVLLGRGLVRKVQDFKGEEPILEVVR